MNVNFQLNNIKLQYRSVDKSIRSSGSLQTQYASLKAIFWPKSRPLSWQRHEREVGIGQQMHYACYIMRQNINISVQAYRFAAAQSIAFNIKFISGPDFAISRSFPRQRFVER